MLKINSNKFNFNFFLSSNKKVNSLRDGAIAYGGATKFKEGIYSNIEGNEFIELKEKNNKISIFIPSTIQAKNTIDNKDYIEKYINKLTNNYKLEDLSYYDTKGSWYSEDLNQVIIEDITIITLEKNTITEQDIKIFIKLANQVKREMSQEAVSISINRALAII